MTSIAIIGAGSSGLAAAHILQDAGHTVTLFEEHTEVGGRAATRQRQGFIYDHGAQYIKGGSPISTSLITERFYVNDLIDIAKPVWIFDQHGHIAQGDPAQNADPKWNYRSGLHTFAKCMAEGLHISLQTLITRFQQTTTGWHLSNISGQSLGTFARLLVTLPAPQAINLITAIYRWQYALPNAKADANALNTLTLPIGLAFCGDGFVGGRVHLALEHGMEVAKQFLSSH